MYLNLSKLTSVRFFSHNIIFIKKMIKDLSVIYLLTSSLRVRVDLKYLKVCFMEKMYLLKNIKIA